MLFSWVVYVYASGKTQFITNSMDLEPMFSNRYVGRQCENLNNFSVSAKCTVSPFLFLLQNVAIQLSGMTKKAYIHAFKTIECLLGKQKEFTIKDLAVQFGCMEASDLAQQIHQRCIIIPSPLHPIISLYTLHTVFSTFLMVLSSIISLTIESLLNL